MCLQAGRYENAVQSEAPSRPQLEYILGRMEEEYSRLRSCADGFRTKERFLWALRRLEYASSPGFPYCQQSSTIGDWLGFDGCNFDQLRVSLLWSDVNLVFLGEYKAIWRCFIKDEPHSSLKVKQGRWRLIIMAPLSVQVVWHMLFGDQNDLEIEEAFSLPSQQGIKMMAGGWKQYYDQWVAKGLNTAMDKSGWDWSFPGWAIEADLELRCRLVYGLEAAEWRMVASKLYEDAFKNTRLILSDGSIYQQEGGWGVMKSGCVNTISTNSHGQLFIHFFYCLIVGCPEQPLPVVAGDDTLSSAIHCQAEIYARMGIAVKHVENRVEFVGHHFTPAGPEPLYKIKHLYRAMYQPDENLAQYFDSMLRVYALSEDFVFWQRVAWNLGLGRSLMSGDYYKAWYNYEM